MGKNINQPKCTVVFGDRLYMRLYNIRNLENGLWADIYLHHWGKGKGTLMIMSDCGNWSYYWGSMGSNIREFLIECDKEYIMDKLDKRSYFNFDATLLGMEKEINNSEDPFHERESAINAMNGYWDDLRQISTSERFVGEYWNWDAPEATKHFSPFPSIVMEYPPSFVNFMNRIWPYFIEAVKQDVEKYPDFGKEKKIIWE